MATGKNVVLESDGRSVDVNLLYTVVKDQVAVVDGWLGITNADGDSGDVISLNVDQREYQFIVPAALSVAKGDIVYVEVADLTGHTPDDTAYSKSAGAGKVALFKATSAQDSNNVVTGVMLNQLLS